MFGAVTACAAPNFRSEVKIFVVCSRWGRLPGDANVQTVTVHKGGGVPPSCPDLVLEG